MRSRSVDVMLIDENEMLAYFTGYETSLSFYRACIIPLSGQPLMVLRKLDAAPFLEQAWFNDHIGFQDTEDAVEQVAAALGARGFGAAAIGFDPGSHALSVDYFRRLQAALPKARFVDMTHIPWELRLIKSAAETQRITRACHIADATVREIIDMVKPGMSGREISAFAAKRFIEQGADPGHVGPITIGRGWDFLHGHLTDEPLTKGDILHMEIVPRFGGYSGRLMRCVVMGPIAPELQKAADQLMRLQDSQIAAIKPGAHARDVDRIMREGVLAAGLREKYENITGYTIGYYSKQPLRSSDFTRTFNPKAEWRVESGMVFHIYASAKGIAFSETVHVTPSGPERLTKIERKLYSC
jgi:Xaa-Pro aminopeptidase